MLSCTQIINTSFVNLNQRESTQWCVLEVIQMSATHGQKSPKMSSSVGPDLYYRTVCANWPWQSTLFLKVIQRPTEFMSGVSPSQSRLEYHSMTVPTFRLNSDISFTISNLYCPRWLQKWGAYWVLSALSPWNGRVKEKKFLEMFRFQQIDTNLSLQCSLKPQ